MNPSNTQQNTANATQMQPLIPPEESPYAMPVKKKNKITLPLLISIFLICIVGCVAVFIYYIQRTMPDLTTRIMTLSPTPFQPILPSDSPSDWIQYTNTTHGVAFNYPSQWTVEEQFNNYPELVAFRIVDPFVVVFEKIQIADGPPESIGNQRTINGITWYQPDPDKPVDKSGKFCSIYNCDEQTYGKEYTLKNGYKYSFYFPTDTKESMDTLLSSFTFVE